MLLLLLILLLAPAILALRGRDIVIVVDASSYVGTDAIHEEHAVFSLMRNYTRDGDYVSLFVSRGDELLEVLTDTTDRAAVVDKACEELHDLQGEGVRAYEMFARANGVFSLLARGHQIPVRDPELFLVSNGLSPSVGHDESALALLQTLHHHWGCRTSVVISTNGNPVQRANLVRMARAGSGRTYATKRGHGPYEIVDVVFGRGERTVRFHRVAEAEWFANVL